MKSISLTFLAAVLLAFMAAGPAAAQGEEGPRWYGGGADAGAVLVYGVPDSDYVLLSFACANGEPVVSVNVQDEESSAGEGDVLHVSLSAGRERIEFSEKAVVNQDSGGTDVEGHLPLDETLRRLLTATGTLEIVVDGHTQRYAMEGAAAPAAELIAACEAPGSAGDLDVTVTNAAKQPLQSFAWSEAGLNAFDSDAFGYEPLAPGESRTFTIPGGRDVCTFDLALTFTEEDDEECCSDPAPAGTQDLCENSAFTVHD